MPTADAERKFFHVIDSKFGKPNRWQVTIGKMSHSQLLNAIADLIVVSPKGTASAARPQEMIATETMSGGTYPCASPDCRIRQADTLARYASFYTDHLAVRNSFADYEVAMRSDRHWIFDPAEVDRLRSTIYGDVATLDRLRPLIESGIAGFVSTPHHFCSACYQHITGNSFDALDERYADLADLVTEELLRSVKFTYLRRRSETVLGAEGSELASCRSCVIVEPSRLPLARAKRAGREYVLRKSEVRRFPILSYLVSHVVEDLIAQDLYASLNPTSSYITDRPLDLRIVADERLNPFGSVAKEMVEGLGHALPVVAKVPIADVVKLRIREPEAFAVYRSAVTRAVKEARESGKKRARQVVQELVQPEVERINQQVRNSRRLLKIESVRDLVYGAGFVTAALWSGLLPAAAGPALAAVGGFKFAADLLRRASQLRSDPEVARSERMFFLWKLSQ